MRTNKLSICLFFPLSIICLVISYYLFRTGKAYDYYQNVVIGVFGSSLTALIVSIIGYKIERRHTLERFQHYACRALDNLDKFMMKKSTIETVDLVISLNNYDYSAFNDAYLEIDFLFFNRRAHKKIDELFRFKVEELINELQLCDYEFHLYKYEKEYDEDAEHIPNEDEIKQLIYNLNCLFNTQIDGEISLDDYNWKVKQLKKFAQNGMADFYHPWLNSRFRNRFINIINILLIKLKIRKEHFEE